ncbi:hypothetical protein BGZ82_006096, partial [Podila clonocystis]
MSISKIKTPLSRSPGRSPSRVYGSIISDPSPPPPPPGQQPRRPIKSIGPPGPEIMDLYFSHPAQPIVSPPPSSKMIMPTPPSHDTAITTTPMTTTTEGLSGRISPPVLRATPTTSSSERGHSTPGLSPLQQLPVLRSCTFYALRIIYFPKTVFVKTVALGRGCASCIGLSSYPYRGRRQQHSRTMNRSHQGRNRSEREFRHRSQSVPDHGYLPSSQRRPRRPRRSGSRSRSRSLPRTSIKPTTTDKAEVSRWKEFLNCYHVQVGMICLCMTGESIAQSVICPFLYYMVRDFHIGLDIWIGYYAGLLLTGYWGANLCTTLFWGHLSDKYGRKAVLLFGLFMTSLSTIYLGLATCYHDAMWALVLQGACTGLVPVSKCAIGEIANREQRIYDAQMATLPRHRHHHRRGQRPLHSPPSYEESYQQEYVVNEKGDIDGEPRITCFSPECGEEVVRERQLQLREDYAAKGYSGLVIAVAIGAALGPLVGGSLAKKQIPGFEKHTYLAPCLLAAGVGLLVTFLVALVLNETNPKRAKPLPLHLLDPSREIYLQGSSVRRVSTTTTTTRRGRPGYEQSRWFLLEEGVLNNVGSSNSNLPGRQSEEEEVDYGGGVGSSGTRPRQPHPTSQPLWPMHPLERAHHQRSLTICTCSHASPATLVISTPPSAPKTTLSPATQLVLILAIYSLLVLTSILGSEFLMLYTQTPVSRGGLEFSARVLGQVLTMRGILKLTFNLFGYPFMVRRLGLIHCLRLGIAVIGTVSILGMGWAVPWSVARERGGGSATTVASGAIGMGEAFLAAGRHGRFNNNNNNNNNSNGNGTMRGDRAPIGMSVVLLCMSMISMGDVLGYISVLVL